MLESLPGARGGFRPARDPGHEHGMDVDAIDH